MTGNPRLFAITITALLALAPGFVGPSLYAADSSADTAKELDRIKREMREQKKGLKLASRKERSVLAELEKIDRDFQAGSAELLDQQMKLRAAEAALRDVEKNSATIGRELANLKNAYGMRLRALYKMQRGGSAAIYAPDSAGGMVKQVKYLGLIAARDREIIRDYGSSLDRLTRREAEIAEKKGEILGRRRTIEAKKAELERKKQRKSAILANVRREKSLYEQTLHELEEASVSLWGMIKKDEHERRSANRATVPAVRHNDSALIDKNKLPWPLDGPVLTRFGMQRHPQFGTMVYRRGIEIEAREGQAVRAVDGGQVAYADWYKGYGKLVILDHGNGFYTLYGNLSRLDLDKGARVAKGQVVGLTGETGSLKGAKLYFEIRKNGEAQDPIAWLQRQ
jgi:septal ring factor EnvC (AmiA/AmiB activator)